MNQALAPRLHDLLTAGEPVVLVEVAVAKGSTPREAGAAMLVTATACLGTIGGGRLEWEGIAGARQLLDEGGQDRLLELPLGPATLRPDELGRDLPEPHGSWMERLEAGWTARYAR